MKLSEVEERLRAILRRKAGSHSHSVGDGIFELAADAPKRLQEHLADIERARVAGDNS